MVETIAETFGLVEWSPTNPETSVSPSSCGQVCRFFFLDARTCLSPCLLPPAALCCHFLSFKYCDFSPLLLGLQDALAKGEKCPAAWTPCSFGSWPAFCFSNREVALISQLLRMALGSWQHFYVVVAVFITQFLRMAWPVATWHHLPLRGCSFTAPVVLNMSASFAWPQDPLHLLKISASGFPCFHSSIFFWKEMNLP